MYVIYAGKPNESMEHLFLKCHFAHAIWYGRPFSFMMDNNIHSSFKAWWKSWIERKKIRPKNMEHIICMSFVLLYIWRARSDKIFRHK